MTTSASKVINVAAGEVGYHEGRSNGHWNNNQKYSDQVPSLEWSDWQAWCATFVSWCAMKADAEDLFPRTASCLTGVRWFKDRDRFSYYPAVGAQVFYGSGGGSHTGLVYKYDSTYIWTIEGNTNTDGSYEGDGVYKKKHRRRDDYVYGYGYPDYPQGIKSADPAWDGHKEKAGMSPKGHADAEVHDGVARYQVTLHGLKYGYGAKGDQVTAVGKKLKALGFDKHNDGDGYQPGPNWTDYDTKNYSDFQKSLGYSGSDADGVPGKTSLDKLFDGNPPSKSHHRAKCHPYPGARYFHKRPHSALITAMGKRLVEEGCSRYSVGPGPQWTNSDRESYAAWQRKLGYRGKDADGWPGKASWDALKVPEV